MRNNQPVTRQEYLADPKRPLVSKTDLKGRITYVNRAFIQISGFPEQELLGQPHNLVRHPDMPPAAYADLWQTIASGHPWRGLVKNRARDGGFYWVDAYVTPLKENGTPVGYMSIRTTPGRAAIEAAEQRYADVRPVARRFRLPASGGRRRSTGCCWPGWCRHCWCWPASLSCRRPALPPGSICRSSPGSWAGPGNCTGCWPPRWRTPWAASAG